jgi:hypothetical protein
MLFSVEPCSAGVALWPCGRAGASPCSARLGRPSWERKSERAQEATVAVGGAWPPRPNPAVHQRGIKSSVACTLNKANLLFTNYNRRLPSLCIDGGIASRDWRLVATGILEMYIGKRKLKDADLQWF